LQTARAELAQVRTRADAERASAQEKLQLLTDAKTALSDQFKTLATEILEEKSKRFAEQNQQNLGTLLDPLRTQLNEFKGKVEEVYIKEGQERFALSEQVKQLMELNKTLSNDANNLTKALKGSAKTQGNWGELILERVLEASGLEKGRVYHVQVSQRDAEGNLQQPDVVIDLPQERKLVVDAKVSLVAYDRFASAESDDERTLAVRQHLDSVRAHIKRALGQELPGAVRREVAGHGGDVRADRAGVHAGRHQRRGAVHGGLAAQRAAGEPVDAAVRRAHHRAPVAPGGADAQCAGHRQARRRALRQAVGVRGRPAEGGQQVEGRAIGLRRRREDACPPARAT
jgi:hypothetical protein